MARTAQKLAPKDPPDEVRAVHEAKTLLYGQSMEEVLEFLSEIEVGASESEHLIIEYRTFNEPDGPTAHPVDKAPEDANKFWAQGGLSSRIQQARVDAGLSVDDVARALRITSSAVRQWELGSKFPSRGRLVAFSRLTGANLGWLQTAVSDTARLMDEFGRALGRPVSIVEPNQIASILPPFSTDFLKEVPWIWPSYPCSDGTFAFKVFNDWNLPEFQIGDLVVIDPKGDATPGDMVLAVVDDQIIFAKYAVIGGVFHAYASRYLEMEQRNNDSFARSSDPGPVEAEGIAPHIVTRLFPQLDARSAFLCDRSPRCPV